MALMVFNSRYKDVDLPIFPNARPLAHTKEDLRLAAETSDRTFYRRVGTGVGSCPRSWKLLDHLNCADEEMAKIVSLTGAATVKMAWGLYPAEDVKYKHRLLTGRNFVIPTGYILAAEVLALKEVTELDPLSEQYQQVGLGISDYWQLSRESKRVLVDMRPDQFVAAESPYAEGDDIWLVDVEPRLVIS